MTYPCYHFPAKSNPASVMQCQHCHAVLLPAPNKQIAPVLLVPQVSKPKLDCLYPYTTVSFEWEKPTPKANA
jgi:hypothetical protein